MSSLGKKARLERMKNRVSGRILSVALDHAPSYGVLSGLENIKQVVDDVVAGGPDAVMLMRGTAARCWDAHAGRMPLIIKTSSISPHHAEQDVRVASVEDAVRLGADAVAMAVTFGSPNQPQHFSDLARLVQEGDRYGVPVIAHAYPLGSSIPEDKRFTVEQVGYAARAVMELGVDIVKTLYTGSAETFAEVVDLAAPALVVAAGGPKLETADDVMEMATEVVRAGAAGITFGRNVWQSDDIGGILKHLKTIVHGDSEKRKRKTAA